MPPLFSIIIPTYNRAALLKHAIKSVIDQSVFAICEIIVCDDGSTDDTQSVVADLAKRYRNISYILLSHSGGPAKPRNAGIIRARGEWIAFLDSDDVWQPDKLKAQLAFATLHHLSFVCTNAIKVGNKQQLVYFPNKPKNINIKFGDLIQDNSVICSSVLVKKSMLTAVGGFPAQKQFIAIEDYICWLKISLIHPLGYIPEPLLSYSDKQRATIRNRWVNAHAQYLTIIPHLVSWYFTNFRLSYRYLSALVPLLRARHNIS